MDESYSLKKSGAIRVLQITDSHLFSSPKDTLLNMNTHFTFQQVLHGIQKTPFNFELVLATGDLIQDFQIEGYHHFAQMVKSLNRPVFWVEGNHDSDPEMANILAKYSHIQPHKQILAGDKWQILLLNTQVKSMPHGELKAEQLAWLQTKLKQYPERFCLIVQHHNILPTNSAWLDQHSLRNKNELAEVLMPFSNVKAILHGHIHQKADSEWNGIRILATPSTCLQFKPNCNQFSLDLLPQGWREIILHENGEIETYVRRLNSNNHLPNLNAEGY